MCSDKKYLFKVLDPSCRFRRPRTSSSSSEAVGQTKTCQVGFPIRTSRDQRVLSPPPGFSQSATSFIASCCQGIHQTPLSRLIRSRRRQALLREGDLEVPQPVQNLLSEVEHDPSTIPGKEDGAGRGQHQCSRTGRRPLGQCLQTWKDCPDCPIASPLEGICPLPAPHRTRSRPHSGETSRRLVFCSLNDVNCHDLPIGHLSVPIPAIGHLSVPILAIGHLSVPILAIGQRSGPSRIRFAFRSPPRPAKAKWWVEEELNLRPHAYQACALTT
jgi:hypothetical protein